MTIVEKMHEPLAELPAAEHVRLHDEPMRYPKQGKGATAILKKRKSQAHRRSQAFHLDMGR